MTNSAVAKDRIVKSTIIGAVLFAIAALLIAAVVAIAAPEKAYASGLTSKSTKNSITLSWQDPCASFSSYTTTGYAIGWVDATQASNKSKIKTKLLDANATSFTITGLKPGTKYAVAIEYACVNSYGIASTAILGSEYLFTRVVKPTGVKQTKWSYKDNKAFFTWDVQTGAEKIQCKLINVATGKAVLDRTFPFARDFYAYGLQKNIMYAVQMRVKDSSGWSPWSSKMYFLSQPLTTNKTKVVKNKMTVAWEKIKGAQKYSVYVSNKAKKGYKRVATVKSNKSSVTLKIYSPKKTYYVYVQATKKVGGKTFTSGKHYAYKVKGARGTMVYPF